MQKFNKGDHVMIAKDLGYSMSHFTCDCEAIVLYSYVERYGGNNTDSYALHIKGKGHTAWYEENQLTLIKANQFGLIRQWENENGLKSGLDIKQPTKTTKISSAKAARIYRHRLYQSGGRTITFACEKDGIEIMEIYRKLGYTSKDLLNFAVSLLPEHMPD